MIIKLGGLNVREPTEEQITNLTDYIVNKMTYQEVLQFVLDDVQALMIEEKEVFYSNLEHYDKKAEDFNDENFRK